MNPLLQVKLRFVNERNTQQVVAKNLRANASTSDDKVYQLIESLRAVKRLIFTFLFFVRIFFIFPIPPF